MKKVVIDIFPLVKDIDFLERTLISLKQSSTLVNRQDWYVILNVTLPVSEYLTDWDSSVIPKSFFINKFESLKPYGDCWNEAHFNIDHSCYGLLDNFINTLKKFEDIHSIILLEPDIVYDKTTLTYLLEAATQVSKYEQEYFITPQTTKLWDDSWDCLVNERYIGEPNHYRDINEPLVDVLQTEEPVEIVPLLEQNQKLYKLGGGWFVLYSKSLFDKIKLPPQLRGYGPLDTFVLEYCYKTGTPTQYVLKNVVVVEDTKYNSSDRYTSYVKSIDRRNSDYEKNVEIMKIHFKNKV
jgi:hypothetical protein